MILIPHDAISFNSRPHKEVDVDEVAEKVAEKIFQFTTSQGGRLSLIVLTS